MIRITLDTNVYVSAFEFGGNPELLIDLALNGELEIAISQPIIIETLRILQTKFGWTLADLNFAKL